MAKPKKLNNDELVAAIGMLEQKSTDRDNSTISDQRATALKYYNGEPYGNERPGKSQFVTREVMDTIEWIMPYLMRTFFGAVDAVEFTPRGPEDVEAARQETAYINYLWQQRNEGFKTAYQWFKDGLLQKNGIVKVWWDEREEITEERYTGLDQVDVDLLAAEDDVAIVDLVENVEVRQVPVLPPGSPPGTPPQMVEQSKSLFDVTITRRVVKGECRVEAVPPEEFVISKGAKSIADAALVQHKRTVTISDLREMGFPEKKLRDLSGVEDNDLEYTDEYYARFSADDSGRDSIYDDETPVDPSQKRVVLKESYLNIDFDGDGRAELRKVITADNVVLENEITEVKPFAGWTPIIMSHKFFGMSVADTVMDLQKLQSTLVRNMLDNQYLANNGRYAVLDNMVNLDDLVHSKPGGYIREKTPGAVRQLTHPELGNSAFQMLSFVDEQRERRTGVSAMTQGIAAETMNSHTTATQHVQAMTAAQQKLELIARVLAETGLKELFRLMHGIVLRHQDKEDMVRINGTYVRVNPSEWRERADMSVNVGIGNIAPDQRIRQMDQIAQMLQIAAGAGANITPENATQFAEDYIRLVNPSAVGRYISPPQPPAPPPPNPDLIKAQVDQAYKQAKIQLEAQSQQLDAKKAAVEADLERKRFALEQEKQSLEEEKFEFEKRLRRVEAMLEASQARPVGLGDD